MNSPVAFLFLEPEWLWLLAAALPATAFFYFFFLEKRSASLKYSSLESFQELGPQKSLRARHLVLWLRLLAVLFFIVALARPQSAEKNSLVKSEGIDIAAVLDLSDSMRGEDVLPMRLEAAKKVLADFIQKRLNDRIGLVLFGAEAFLQCPLTLDHNVLLDFLRRVTFVPELGNQTAIGMGLGTGIVALKKSKAKSRVIILMTDGVNNAGSVDPYTAANLAAQMKIRVYTVGIGRPGISEVMITHRDPLFGERKIPMQNEMREEPLREIAQLTGGEYFNAQTRAGFEEVLRKIDRLEKSEITSTRYLEYSELFPLFVTLGLLSLLAEIILRSTRFRKIP